MPSRLLAACLLFVAIAAKSTAAGAQRLLRPHLAWRTLQTEHFAFHFPAELEPWTRHVAERMESVREVVSPLVGSVPRRRTTVIVDDPYNQTNGMAFARLGGPVIYLWPTPPDPRSGVANTRSFPEELAVHEFAHIAHLTRPSRRPVSRLIRAVVPGARDRAMTRPPRWVVEGYATYVEGVLTGSGRPHGVYRPSVLRQWALEGKLPNYAQLNGSGSYLGDAFAYYAGSAFIEWLTARKGDTSLVLLWRRLSARQPRSFDDAFAGVYGGLPADLYGRFTVELTTAALEARRTLAASGADTGAVVQRLNNTTGNPALSADGKLIALLTRPAAGRPGQIVVWETVEKPDTMAERRRKRLLELDPQDVPAVEYQPPPKRVVSRLPARRGREFREPRFFGDGNRVMVVRDVARPDGSLRPALFVWDRKARSVTKVRGGDGMNYADPAPDGRSAVGTRCARGSCDLVRLDLGSGRLTVLAAGGPTTAYHRPRYSPDGRSVAVGEHQQGRWRVALLDDRFARTRMTGRPYGLTDERASRYEPAFTRDGKALIVVSELGGVANLERVEIEDSARTHTLTQVTGAAVAPEPAPDGSVYFLTFHSKGYDLRRLAADSAPAVRAVALDPRLSPVAAVPPVPADTPAVRAIAASRRYGVGPRSYRLLPTTLGGAVGLRLETVPAGSGRDELMAGGGIASVDPVGRLSWIAQGVVSPGSGPWRGAALQTVWRGSRPAVRGELFYLDQRVSLLNPELRPLGHVFDVRYRGALLSASLNHQLQPVRAQSFDVGISAGRWTRGAATTHARTLAYAEYAGAFVRRDGRGARAELRLHGAAGRLSDSAWARGTARLALSAPVFGRRLFADGFIGRVSNDAPVAERFLLGGLPSPLVDPSALSQRVASPGLPPGAMVFERGGFYRLGAEIGVLQPYYAEVHAPRRGRDFLSLYGVDYVSRTSAIPFLRLPAVRVQAGGAVTMQETVPWQRFRGYLMLQVMP